MPILLLTYLAVYFDWAPPVTFTYLWEDPVEHFKIMLLPTFLIGLSSSGALIRFTRTFLLEVMRQDYIRTARSKGLPERTVFLRHALRNVALPFITIVGATIPTLFAGSVILELLFSLPGMGRYLVNAALNYDYNVVMTTTMFFAIITLTTQLLTDLSYAWFDPRVSYGAKPLTLILTLGVLTGLTSCDRLGWSASAAFPGRSAARRRGQRAPNLKSVQFLEV